MNWLILYKRVSHHDLGGGGGGGGEARNRRWGSRDGKEVGGLQQDSLELLVRRVVMGGRII